MYMYTPPETCVAMQRKLRNTTLLCRSGLFSHSCTCFFDIVIFSRALRQVILIELTVPLEDRVCLAHERKRNRYLPLLSLCQSNGWNATHFPVEVGSRGFVAYSLMRCLTQLGFPPYWAKKVRNEASKVSLRCSYLIYLRRNIRVWQERLGD